jgi:hypothetical protein
MIAATEWCELISTGIQIFILPVEDLVALAKSRVTRTLTTEECLKYLHLNACPASP